jgi:hypothetical protein
MVVLVVRWAQISYPQGRLLFPAVTALATLLAIGWSNLWPQRAAAWGGLALACLLLPVALVAPWRWIGPAYRPPALLAADTPLPNPVNVRFADQLLLRGYTWSPTELRPGGLFDLTLFWAALRPADADYSVFVHLVDERAIIQAQRDSYPAGGSWPTREWPQQLIVPDRHRIQLPAVLPAPAELQVEVGLYDFASGRRLSPSGATNQAADAFVLGRVPILPAAADERPQLRVNFGDEIALVDYRFDRWQVRAGEDLAITLYWEALTKPSHDLVVFVHLLLPPDAVWAQRDAVPQDGARPTSGWQAGETIKDRYVIAVPATAPEGLYTVEIGFYEPESGERLKVGLSDAGYRLGQVRVVK